MTHYLLGAALALGIVSAALFGTAERGAQSLSSAEQADAAEWRTTKPSAPTLAGARPDGAAVVSRGKR
jgi:hypothetical protein